MKNHILLMAVTALALAFSLGSCSKEDEAAKQEEKSAPITKLEEKSKETSTRLAELGFEYESLKSKVAKLEKRDREIARLELELGEAKRKVDRLERQLFQPDKPATKIAEKKAVPKPAKKKLLLPEPVPTEKKKDDKTARKPDTDVAPPVEADSGGTDSADVEEAQELPPGSVSVVNVKFAPGVDRQTRQPVDEKSEFNLSDERVYCWLVFSNAADEETKAILNWKFDGNVIQSIELRVGRKTSHWRTWAYIRTNAKLLGEWEVELLDLGGNVLGTGNFTMAE